MSWFKRSHAREEDEIGRMVTHAAQLHGVANKDVVDVLLDEEEEYEGRGSRRPGVWITFVVVGVIFGVGIVMMMKFVNEASVSGPIVSKQIEESKQSAQPSPEMPSLEGLKVAFSFPRVFSDVSRVRNASGVEQYVLRTKGDGASVQIAVVVEDLPSGNLQDDSSYTFRTLKASHYVRTDTILFNEPAVEMTKDDGSERTLFWPHKGMVLVLSGTTSGPIGDLVGYMDTITKSLRWLG